MDIIAAVPGPIVKIAATTCSHACDVVGKGHEVILERTAARDLAKLGTRSRAPAAVAAAARAPG